MTEQAGGELLGEGRGLSETKGITQSIPEEWRINQPRWLSLKHMGERTEDDLNLTLQVYSLSINPGELMPESGLSQAEISFLSRYHTDIRLWSEAPLINWYGVAANPRTFTTLLTEGLASNHTQWMRIGNSFVHRWHDFISRKILPKLPPTQPDIKPLTLAVSCPGFGGSILRDESHVSTHDVSDRTFARYIDVLVKLLRIPDERAIAGGHSAGGEALLTWAMEEGFTTSLPIVALHPAVGVDFQKLFSRLANAYEFSRIVTGMLGDIKRDVLKRILRGVLSLPPFGELTLQQEHQVASIMKEIKDHPAAFAAKLTELAPPRKPNPTRLKHLAALPLVLTGSKDKLTPRDVQLRWLGAAFITKYLTRLAPQFRRLPQFQRATTRDLKQFIETAGDWGHVAVFTDEKPQMAAIALLGRQLELQLTRQTLPGTN